MGHVLPVSTVVGNPSAKGVTARGREPTHLLAAHVQIVRVELPNAPDFAILFHAFRVPADTQF